MSRELNWVFDMNVSQGSSGSFLGAIRGIFLYVKNQLVALGGWEVVASSGTVGTVWEFEGVTGGGSYGGESTGPYDVWSSTSVMTWALNGSRPSFVILKSPLWEGKRMYLLMGLGSGNSYYNPGYCAASTEMPVLVDADVAYYPVAASENSEWVFWSGDDTRPYYWYGDLRTQFSVCTDNGSFVLTSYLAGSTVIHGIMAACRLDPRKDAPSIALACGHNGNGNFRTLYTHWWRSWSPTPGTWNDNQSPTVAGYQATQWAEPMRGGTTSILQTDMSTVNCFGNVDPFPFYLITSWQTGNIEYKAGMFGRIPDLWIAPFSLVDMDTVGAGGSIEYYVCGYWLIPGNVAPVPG